MRKTNILSNVILLSAFGLSLFSCSSNKDMEIVNRALDCIEDRVYLKIRDTISFPNFVSVIYEENTITVKVTWKIIPDNCFEIAEESDAMFYLTPLPTNTEIEVTFVATATYNGVKASKTINGLIMPSN